MLIGVMLVNISQRVFFLNFFFGLKVFPEGKRVFFDQEVQFFSNDRVEKNNPLLTVNPSYDRMKVREKTGS
jgi:hypothetical protein